MNRRIHAVICAAAVLALVPSTSAWGDDDSWEAGPAGWRSGPIIEHVGNLPLEAGAIGAVRHGRHLFVSTARSFSIYGVSQPAEPRLLATREVPAVLNEHPDTNGKILILSLDLLGFARVLDVWDVRDKTNPTPLARFVSGTMGGGDHTWACVLDCSFAYGSQGTIVDLRNPAEPQKVGDWRTVLPPGTTVRPHGIDQVAPGMVMAASEPTVVLDAREDPTQPTLVALVKPPSTTFGVNRRSIPSYAHWPLEATERFALETIETPFSGPCTAASGGLVSYDTAGYEETGTFEVEDVYRFTQNGTFTDGQPPANAVGCSAFGLAESPDWASDRLVAVAAMEHGVRLFRVDLEGTITELGGFMGHGTEAAYPVWGSRRILYVSDLTRGLDIFRVREPAA